MIKSENTDYYFHMMAYHTGLRNVGLYISISLASLGFIKFLKINNKYTNLIISALLLIPLAINYKLIKDTSDYIKSHSIDSDNIGHHGEKHREIDELQYWKSLNIYIGIFTIIFIIYLIKDYIRYI